MENHETPLKTENSMIKTVVSYASGAVLIAAFTLSGVV